MGSKAFSINTCCLTGVHFFESLDCRASRKRSFPLLLLKSSKVVKLGNWPQRSLVKEKYWRIDWLLKSKVWLTELSGFFLFLSRFFANAPWAHQDGCDATGDKQWQVVDICVRNTLSLAERRPSLAVHQWRLVPKLCSHIGWTARHRNSNHSIYRGYSQCT